MASVVILSPDIVVRVTRDPAIFTVGPFLAPVQAAATRLHERLGNSKCTSCARRAILKAAAPLAAAFAKLLVDESAKSPNTLAAVKASMAAILNTQIDEVLVQYVQNGKNAELRF